MTNMPPPDQQPPAPQGPGAYSVSNPQPTVPFQPMAPVGQAPVAAGPAGKGRSKLPLALAALVVLAAIGAGVFFLTKDDDDNGGALDTKAAATTLSGLLDAAAQAVPGQCPTVDLDEIAAKAPEKLEASVAADGDETVAFQELGGKRLLTCIGTAGDNSARVLAGEPFDASFEESLPKALPGFKIDFSKPESLKGGTLQTYCALGASDNARSCAAQWFDKDLRVGVVSTKSDSTAEDAAQWLKDSLDDIVTSIAKAAPTSGSAPGS